MTAPSRPSGASVTVARALFEALLDDADRCVCHALPAHIVCSGIAMRTTHADYDTPDGVLL